MPLCQVLRQSNRFLDHNQLQQGRERCYSHTGLPSIETRSAQQGNLRK
jgi:hypothetical protein